MRVAFADSEHGPLRVFDGGHEPDGISLYTEVARPGRKILLRTRLLQMAADSFVTESQRSLDEGKTWDTTSRAEYQRRANP